MPQVPDLPNFPVILTGGGLSKPAVKSRSELCSFKISQPGLLQFPTGHPLCVVEGQVFVASCCSCSQCVDFGWKVPDTSSCSDPSLKLHLPDGNNSSPKLVHL